MHMPKNTQLNKSLINKVSTVLNYWEEASKRDKQKISTRCSIEVQRKA